MALQQAPLDWSVLVAQLTTHCVTEGGQTALQQEMTQPLTQPEIEAYWHISLFFKQLISEKKHIPLDDFQDPKGFTHAAHIGRTLEGSELRHVHSLLKTTEDCHKFLKIYGRGDLAVEELRQDLEPIESLCAKIEAWVQPDGQLHDHASGRLQEARSQIKTLRKKIESRLEFLMRRKPTQTYLQDSFFTIRSGRYVLPIRLDGHGRVPGRVIDTSASQETLFVHPSEIEGLNQDLQNAEIEEQIEVMRLLKTLSQEVGDNRDAINNNALTLTRLDVIQARSTYAEVLKAHPISLTDETSIELYQARHPLLRNTPEQAVVANDIVLGKESGLVISGPNAGGKTLILKTVGLIYQMTRVGLLVPAAPHSRMKLFDHIKVEIGDHQSLESNLSTFSAHMTHVSEMVRTLTSDTLILLDELGVGTEPETGAALAQAILEHLVEKSCTFLVTTHYERIKTLAIENNSIRNASMAYDTENIRPLYRLQLDIPGQSFGFNIAAACQMPQSIQVRARKLRGENRNSLEDVTQQLQKAHLAAENLKNELLKEKQQVLIEKEKWQQDLLLQQDMRQNMNEQIRKNYHDLARECRIALREFEKSPSQQRQEKTKEKLAQLAQHVEQAAPAAPTAHDLIPLEQAKPGLKVHIIHLQQNGTVLSEPQGSKKFVSVETKRGKIKVQLKDLTWCRS